MSESFTTCSPATPARTSFSVEPLMGHREPGSTDLSTESTLITFETGIGLSIYNEVLLPAILTARREVILVTCFWAASKTQERLVATLKQLSTQCRDQERITVYICFSSRSILQKLFHASSPDGYVYPPELWQSKLGIPSASELPGLDITIKSLFFRPFSVLHSKFLIVDRQRLYLPSCNVSWEDWFECCVGLSGPIVNEACGFFDHIWRPPASTRDQSFELEEMVIGDQARTLTTALLPHPHDSSLKQALWFLSYKYTRLPITPLNYTLLRAIMNVESEVVMLTPNFTSDAAFWATCFALRMGADVHLMTDRRMLVPEQLVTAGTITERRVDKLIRLYQQGLTSADVWKMFQRYAMGMSPERLEYLFWKKPSLPPIGRLRVSYFLPGKLGQRGYDIEGGAGKATAADKSHIKLTLIRNHMNSSIVLGSGNADRASWHTSQELGVLIHDPAQSIHNPGMIEQFWSKVEKDLEGCLESYFDGKEADIHDSQRRD